MTNDSLIHLKYPIGKYAPPVEITPRQVEIWISKIENFPKTFIDTALSLSEQQLNTPYRTGGWTARQVIHHVPDSHVNSYIRFKWALTENNPTIKPYNEAAWAVLDDTIDQPIQASLDFLITVHIKLVNLLRNITSEQMKHTFVHPEMGKKIFLDWNIGLYAWHGEHHLAHLNLCKKAVQSHS